MIAGKTKEFFMALQISLGFSFAGMLQKYSKVKYIK